jgi:hypothetical protein
MTEVKWVLAYLLNYEEVRWKCMFGKSKFTMVERTVFLLNVLEVDQAVFDEKKQKFFCGA